MLRSVMPGFPAIIVLLGIVVLAGCVNVPTHGNYKRSHQLPAADTSPIVQQVAALDFKYDDENNAAVRLVNTGYEAWIDRVRLVQMAETSLDFQYFSWDTDESGIVMLSHVVDAADRGVRVRILIDDMMAVDQEFLAYAQAHKNIEVRMFNPFSAQYVDILVRPFEWLAKERVNVRMHNKVMVADSAVAIIGGRNIENRYFWVDQKFNHRDLGIWVAGPLVNDASDSFDDYWNSDWTVPIAKLEKIPGKIKAKKFYKRMRTFRELEHIETMFAAAEWPPLGQYDLTRDLVLVKAVFSADDPDKVEHRKTSHYNDLAAIIEAETQQELLIGMAYVIPSQGMMDQKQALVERGVKVKLLTNSMASIDFPAAFSGYLASREEMLDIGMELYEFAVDADYDSCLVICGNAHMSFHSKLIVVDRKVSYVGSMNYDPRSIDFNTEAGVIVYNAEFSERVADVFFEDVGTRNSWHVTHASPTTWTRPGLGEEKEIENSEPEGSALSSMGVLFFRALVPLRDQY